MRQLLRRFEQPWQAQLQGIASIRELALLGLELEQLTGSPSQVCQSPLYLNCSCGCMYLAVVK